MNVSTGTDGYETHYLKLTDKVVGDFVPLFTGFDHKNDVIDHKDGKFLVRTDIGSPRYRVVSIDLNDPAETNWTDVLPEREHFLEGISTAGGFLFAQYLEDASTSVYRYN